MREAADPRGHQPGRTVRRADIQGLRAIAVTTVLVYHFFPSVLPGGFVGVDVFFVISGYLITLLLLGEVERTGTVSLSHFYMRRVCRLMPAALTTTAVTVAVAAVVFDPVRLVQTLEDAAWTSAYAANVHFARDATGYFALSTPSPLLHFWSLAVEEQYYLVWPALLLALTATTRKRFVNALPVVLAVIIAGSLLASDALTKAGSTNAYYSLATRAWELAIGGVVACLVSRRRLLRPGTARSLASGIGMAAVAYAAVSFDGNTAFPGTAALVPTVGTALIIWTGTGHEGLMSRMLGVGPVQAVGDASYSLYLWHWPVLVLGEEIVGSSATDRFALALVAVILGFASFHRIEQPSGRIAHGWRPRKVLGLGLAATLIAAAVPARLAPFVRTTGGTAVASVPAASAEATIANGVVTVTLDRTMRPPDAVPVNVEPSLGSLKDDLAEVFTNGCFTQDLKVCEGGDPAGSVRIVLAGDSHAGQWWPAIDPVARQRGWKLFLVGKNGCALADVPISLGTTGDPWPDCAQWQRDAVDAVVALRADVVLYANHAQGYREKVSLRDDFERRWTQGVTSTLDRFTAVSTVVMFGQSPILSEDPTTCLAAHLTAVAACATPIDAAVLPVVRQLVSGLASDNGAIYFDPTSLLCQANCPVIDGNSIVYRDIGHLNRSYSRSLGDALEAVVDAALGARTRPRTP